MSLRRNPAKPDPAGHPAQARLKELGRIRPMDPADRQTFPADVLEALKWPTFDIWKWSDEELVYLMEAMFDRFGLFEQFKINKDVFEHFMRHVQYAYNDNPFHNFKHCFCVTQMVRVA